MEKGESVEVVIFNSGKTASNCRTLQVLVYLSGILPIPLHIFQSLAQSQPMVPQSYLEPLDMLKITSHELLGTTFEEGKHDDVSADKMSKLASGKGYTVSCKFRISSVCISSMLMMSARHRIRNMAYETKLRPMTVSENFLFPGTEILLGGSGLPQ